MINPPCHSRTAETIDHWITPVMFRDRLGPFDLDPCACIPQPWPMANRQYTEADDGLLLPWSGFVWCNPPYGRALSAWLNRMSLHDHGIAMVFARTETRAFFKYVWPKCSSILFVKGRVTFHRPDGSLSPQGHNSGGPTCLIGYGEIAKERLTAASDLGVLLFPQTLSASSV
jgi:hypothetical protein